MSPCGNIDAQIIAEDGPHYLLLQWTGHNIDRIKALKNYFFSDKSMAITNTIFASTTVSITELRRNPGAVIEEAGGMPVAILNHNRPAAYLVPAEAFEAMLEKLEDVDLAELVRQRRGGKTVKVSLDDL
jgi:antitoxin StbD